MNRRRPTIRRPTIPWPWPGHSSGPDPYPTMTAVAERLVGRCAASAQRHPGVLPDQRVVLTEDRDVAADEQRAVRTFPYRGCLGRRLLRLAVQAAEVQRARGTIRRVRESAAEPGVRARLTARSLGWYRRGRYPGCVTGAEGVRRGYQGGPVTVAPATPRLVDRGDLVAALDRAAAGKVTVISAPAGSGKTSLLRAWAGGPGRPRRLAVLQVRRDEQDAQQFWLALLDAIRHASAVRGLRLQPPGDQCSPGDPRAVRPGALAARPERRLRMAARRPLTTPPVFRRCSPAPTAGMT
jgi:hypothetical protein